jgi:hypothetical protein
MAVTGVTGKPEVVKLGGAVEERYDYVDGGVIAAGDLIRLTTAGEIKVAGTTNTSPPHGMALEAVTAEVNEPIAVLMFASDTVISLPMIDAESPADVAKGQSYTIEKGTGGVWAMTATTTNGSVTVTSYADDGLPWEDRYSSFDQASATDNNRVYVRVKQSLLDTNAA